MKKFLLFAMLLVTASFAWGQATLPLSRTTWNAGEPTGWTNSGCSARTTSGACTGNNATIFDATGDSRTVNFASTPDQLVFKLKKQSMSGQSKMVVEESSNGTDWTIIGNYGTATGATTITDCGDITISLSFTSRYVKWTYTKATGNCDMDDVSITSGATTPTVSFDANSSTTTEQASPFNLDIPVTMSNYSTPVTLGVAVTGGTAGMSDYTLNTTSLVFNADGIQNVSVTVNNDADAINETIVLTLTETSATGVTIGTATHTITVEDIDCIISSVSATPSCDGDDANVVVSWTAANTSGTVEVDVNGNGYTTLTSGGTYVITGPTTAAAGVTVTVRDAAETTCLATTTVDVPLCPQLVETFTNIPTTFSTSYEDRTWTGDDGVTTWHAIDARTDRTIDGKAVTIRTGSLYNSTPISGGIGSLTLTTRREFTGGSGDLIVEVNGTEVGTIPFSNAITTTTINSINVTGNFDLEIIQPVSGERVSLDNLTWTSFTVVPVELTSFTANNTDKGVALAWATATEENNRAFEVQRSSNGRDFETIATVAGAGTTYEAQNYNYLDEQPLNGVNYYRLKQVDFDGSFELHRVVAVLVAAKGSEVAILPTEVMTQFDLVFGEALTTDAQVQIYNFNGQLLHSETIAAGNQRQTIDAAAFAAGIYVVRIQTNGVSTAARFVKL